MTSVEYAPNSPGNPTEHHWVVCFDGYDETTGFFEGQYCKVCKGEVDGDGHLTSYQMHPITVKCKDYYKCPPHPH